MQDALLLEFFWRLIRALPKEALDADFLDASFDDAFPARMRRFFQTHLDRNLSVPEMAEMLGMSESSLAHKCKAILGYSPARAFLACKMERAGWLLAHTEMNVKEIAFRLGFADPYHFSRTFKRFLGKSPSACRKKPRKKRLRISSVGFCHDKPIPPFPAFFFMPDTGRESNC